MSGPEVSIVLPVYNGACYLAESIESCLALTGVEWELICVDDCSTDATPEILRAFAARDSRIRVLRNERNLKLPGSLNRGFAEARGRYWTWTSDDNRYKARALEVLKEILDREPSTDLVYSDYEWIDEMGQHIRDVSVEAPDRLIDGNGIGACFLYRKSLAQKVGEYATEFFLGEDYDYWLRAWAVGTLRPLHGEPLYEYRMHEQSLTSQQAHRTGKIADQILLKHLDQLPIGQRERVRARLRCIAGALRRREWSECARLGIVSLTEAPLLTVQGVVRKALGATAPSP